MGRVLQLAARAAGRTAPNPMVGAVLVQNGQVVGEGWHRGAGHPHAETEALAKAGPRARGATLYVNLEPCSHHGRTPPCADALIAAGVSQVIASMEDPDPRVRGQGFDRLRAAGIAVRVGVEAERARQLNRWYVTSRTRGRPRVLYKWAQTLDGAVATTGGDAHWVSGKEARREVHRLRARLDAVVVGIGTVLSDDPRLTVRHTPGRDPLRVVADRQARTPPTARLLPAWVCVGPDAPTDRVHKLESAGARVVTATTPQDILAALQRHGCLGVLLEGGPRLAAAFLAAGCVDEVAVAVAPSLVGGGLSPFAGPGVARMAQALPLRDLRVRRLGADLWITGMV